MTTTPGPWKTQEVIGLPDEEFIAIMTCDGKQEIAIIPRIESRLDDATLLAASPEMRDALQACKLAFDDLFARCASNGVFTRRGKSVPCALLNEAIRLTDLALKKASAS